MPCNKHTRHLYMSESILLGQASGASEIQISRCVINVTQRLSTQISLPRHQACCTDSASCYGFNKLYLQSSEVFPFPMPSWGRLSLIALRVDNSPLISSRNWSVAGGSSRSSARHHPHFQNHNCIVAFLGFSG